MDNESAKQINNSNGSPDILEQAKQLLAEGRIEDSLAVVKGYWLENPEDGEAAALFSELMKESGRSELSKRLNSLAQQLPVDAPLRVAEPLEPPYSEKSEPDASKNESKQPATNKPARKEPSSKELFEAGYSLIDARQHELAAMLLNRAARIAPLEPTVNYELGFSLMSMKRFEQAIPHFEQALEVGADFDTLLNLLVCYTLIRQADKAQQTLERMTTLTLDQEQKQELSHRKVVLRRLETMRSKSKLTSRDWLYVLYGSILLRPSAQTDERIKEDPQSIGQMLAILKGVLEGLSAMPELVEYYGLQSKPLAQALGEFLEVPISNYKGSGRPEHALLTMTWASDIIGPHKTFMTKEKNRAIFSYALTWDEPLPIVPEVVGTLGFDEPMPWNENTPAAAQKSTMTDQSNFTPAIQKAYKAILANARNLESDPKTIKSVQEALDYYDGKRTHLVLCNSDGFASRSEYTAEIID